MITYSAEQIADFIAFLKAPLWTSSSAQLPLYLSMLCTGDELASYEEGARRRSLSSNAWQRETVNLSTLVAHARWDAFCAVAAIPLETVQKEFFARHPEQRGRVIIVGTHFDSIYAKTVILVWAPIDKREADELRWQIRGVFPGTIAIAYNTELAAIDLGIPYEIWEPLWACEQRQKHCVYVADESDYLSAAVGQSAHDHTVLRSQMGSIAKGLRETFQQGADPEMVYGTFALLVNQCEQFIHRYTDLSPDTFISTEEIDSLRLAAITRNVFNAAYTAIRQHQQQWEEAGQFGELIVRVVEKLPEIQELETVRLCALWGDVGATIATAGIARSMIHRPLPNWAQEVSESSHGPRPIHNSRLAHYLDTEAGEGRDAREQRLNEDIAGLAYPMAVEWRTKKHDSGTAALKSLRQLISISLEKSGGQFGDTSGTQSLNVAGSVIVSDEDESPHLPMRYDTALLHISAEQEFLALHASQQCQAQAEEERQTALDMLRAAKLSPQQQALMEKLYIDGRTTEQTVDELDIPRNSINRQRARAIKALRDYHQTLTG